MKNPNDPIGNRIRILTACRTQCQQTLPRRTPKLKQITFYGINDSTEMYERYASDKMNTLYTQFME
jgi:hypothetical protein